MRRWHFFVCCCYDDVGGVFHWPFYVCSLVTWPPGGDPASKRCNLSLARPQISNPLDNFPDVSWGQMLRNVNEHTRAASFAGSSRGYGLWGRLWPVPAFNSLWTNHKDGTTRKTEYKVDRLGRNLKLVDYRGRRRWWWSEKMRMNYGWTF